MDYTLIPNLLESALSVNNVYSVLQVKFSSGETASRAMVSDYNEAVKIRDSMLGSVENTDIIIQTYRVYDKASEWASEYSRHILRLVGEDAEL